MNKPRQHALPAGQHLVLVLRLYVVPSAPNSVIAIANATAICNAHFKGAYHLEVIDILQHPDRALEDGVVVSPTLVRVAPLPLRRVLGALTDTQQLLLALRAA